MDILTLLWEDELVSPNEPEKNESDIFFSSKGHDVPAVYAVMLGHGRLPFEKIHELRRLQGLPGHPNVGDAGYHHQYGVAGHGAYPKPGACFWLGACKARKGAPL